MEVKLKHDAYYWDKKPITSEDVVYSYKLGLKYPTAPSSPLWTYINDVVAVDNYTVRFYKPSGKNVLAIYMYLSVPIVPKHIYSAKEKEGISLSEWMNNDLRNLIGSGCYKPILYVEGERLVAKRVDDWWGKKYFGLPAPEYLIDTPWVSNEVMAMKFEEGLIDWGIGFVPKIWELWEVKGLKRRTWFLHKPYFFPGKVVFLLLNIHKYPLSEPEVRRAMAYAINVDELIDKAMQGYAPKATPSFLTGYVPALDKCRNKTLEKMYGWEYDPEKANEILDKLNFKKGDDGIRVTPNGTRLGPYELSVPYGYTDWMMACEIIAKYLKNIGIEVTTYYPDRSVWYDKLYRGEFDLVITLSSFLNIGVPWSVWRFFDSRMTGPIGKAYPAGDYNRYHNPELNSLLDKVLETTKEEELMKIYSKIQEILMKDLPGIPLWCNPQWYGFNYEYWEGWPCEENPVWAPTQDSYLPHSIIVLFSLRPAGEEKVIIPKLPPELHELPKKFVSLEGTVGELSSGVNTLSKSVDDLKGTVAQLNTMLTSVLAVQVLTLIISIVAVIRTRRG